jgi:hypothetical protein
MPWDFLAAMLRLVIVHHQTGVDHAGDPTGQGKEQAQNKAEDATGHQDSDRRKSDAKKVAERFQEKRPVISDKQEIGRSAPNYPMLRLVFQTVDAALTRSRHPDSGIGFFQSRTRFGLSGLPQFLLGVNPFLCLVDSRLRRGWRVGRATGQKQAADSQKAESEVPSLHHP